MADRLAQLESEIASLRSSVAANEANDSGSYTTFNCYRPGAFFGAEATLLVPQANTLSATGSVLGNSIGSLQLTPQYGSFVAGRFWGGYRNEEGLGARLRYWNYHATASGTLAVLPIDTTFSMLAVDLEATQLCQVGLVDLDFSGGLRWGETENRGVFTGGSFGQEFTGIGPTAALFARRPIGYGNFALVGGGRASMLFGNNDTSAQLGNLVDATLTAEGATVMIYEMQGGLEWSRVTASGSRVFVRSVFEGQAWQVPPVALGLLSRTNGLVGVAFSAGWNW